MMFFKKYLIRILCLHYFFYSHVIGKGKVVAENRLRKNTRFLGDNTTKWGNDYASLNIPLQSNCNNLNTTTPVNNKPSEEPMVVANNFSNSDFMDTSTQRPIEEILIENRPEKGETNAYQSWDNIDKKVKGSEIVTKFSSMECIDHRNKDTVDKNENSIALLNSFHILGLFALTKKSVPTFPEQSDAAAVKLAVQHVNQMRVLGCRYQLHLIVNDSQADSGVAVNNFFETMFRDKKKNIKAILVPSNTEVTTSLAKISAAWHLPTVSSGESSPELSDSGKYPMFFSLVAPDSSHNQARIAFIHFFKWDSVVTICQQEDKYLWSINHFLAMLETSNITQEKSISFSEQDIVTHLKLVKERDSKIIVASFSEQVAPALFCKIHDLGLYGGDYVWILPAFLRNKWWNLNVPCSRRKLIESVNGTIFIGSKRRLEDREQSVSFTVDEEFEKLLPEPKSNFVRESYDSVWSIALSLRKALEDCNKGKIDCHNDSFHPTFQRHFTSNFQRIQFQGISGPVLFQGANRLCVTNFYQIQNGEVYRIAEYNPIKVELNFNCPRCRKILWPSDYIPVSKRTYQVQTVHIIPLAFIIVNLFSLAGIIISLWFLIMNIYYREQKYIKLSSPYLNATTIMGCILVYISVIFLGMDSAMRPDWLAFPIICTARVTLISTGCTLAFGSIFAKTYRVHQIFIKSNRGILKSKVLQNSRLVPIIGFFVFIDGVIISFWVFVDPLHLHLYNLTLDVGVHQVGVIRQLQVEICESEYKNTWLFSLSIYKAIFIILGLYMAWETRNVKIPSLNDSEHIGLTVYTVSITVVLHFTLANVISDRITLAYLTSSSLILFTTTSSMCLLFLPKITFIFKTRENVEKFIGNSDLKIESNTVRFIKNDDQEPYYRVHIQNFAYKKYITFLDKEIQDLHYRIFMKMNNQPNFMMKSTSSKVSNKIPLSRFRREKSSSLCGGMPNLFMLTVLPVVMPRASWPYDEHPENPVAEEVKLSLDPRLHFMKYRRSSFGSPNNVPHHLPQDERRRHSLFAVRQIQKQLPTRIIKGGSSRENSASLEKPYIDDYEDTSSEAEENQKHPMKICEAIIHEPVENTNFVTPTITVTDVE